MALNPFCDETLQTLLEIKLSCLKTWIFSPFISTLPAKVFTEGDVTAWKGDTVRLSCSSTLNVYGLYWYKFNVSEAVAQIFNKEMTSNVERFSVDNDYSLVI